MQDGVMEEVKKMFKPEFLNRIDETIVFHQLTKDDMKSIIEILLKEINHRISNQMGVNLEVTEEAKSYLVDKGYDKKYGARPLKRTIQNLIEDKLAEEILDGSVRQGDIVIVDVLEDNNQKELVFSKKSNETVEKGDKNETELV